MGVFLLPFSSPFSASSPPSSGHATRASCQKKGRPRAAGCRCCRCLSNGRTTSGTGRSRQGAPLPLLFFGSMSPSRRRRGVVQVLGGGADVKSEPFDVAADSTVPGVVKFSEAVEEARRDVEEDLGTGVLSWTEALPKRWVIVILCSSAFLLCNMDRVCGKYEHCHPSHVGGVQLESCYSWLDPVFLLLGLPSHPDCRWYMGRYCWWKACLRIWSCLVVYCNCSDAYSSKDRIAFSACCTCFHGYW